jgi:hypothetical protein
MGTRSGQAAEPGVDSYEPFSADGACRRMATQVTELAPLFIFFHFVVDYVTRVTYDSGTIQNCALIVAGGGSLPGRCCRAPDRHPNAYSLADFIRAAAPTAPARGHTRALEPMAAAPGPNKFHREHVIPRSRGGNNGPDNYLPACRTCNLRKGARTPEEWYRSLEE